MMMNLSNPLPPIRLAYETAQDSFRVAKRAIKTQHPPARQRLLQRTYFESHDLTEAERIIAQFKKQKVYISSLKYLKIAYKFLLIN